jgi:hypothetical protein
MARTVVHKEEVRNKKQNTNTLHHQTPNNDDEPRDMRMRYESTAPLHLIGKGTQSTTV